MHMLNLNISAFAIDRGVDGAFFLTFLIFRYESRIFNQISQGSSPRLPSRSPKGSRLRNLQV